MRLSYLSSKPNLSKADQSGESTRAGGGWPAGTRLSIHSGAEAICTRLNVRLRRALKPRVNEGGRAE